MDSNILKLIVSLATLTVAYSSSSVNTELIENALTAQQAENNCVQRGGHLSSISNIQKLQSLSTIVGEEIPGFVAYIGLFADGAAELFFTDGSFVNEDLLVPLVINGPVQAFDCFAVRADNRLQAVACSGSGSNFCDIPAPSPGEDENNTLVIFISAAAVLLAIGFAWFVMSQKIRNRTLWNRFPIPFERFSHMQQRTAFVSAQNIEQEPWQFQGSNPRNDGRYSDEEQNLAVTHIEQEPWHFQGNNPRNVGRYSDVEETLAETRKLRQKRNKRIPTSREPKDGRRDRANRGFSLMPGWFMRRGQRNQERGHISTIIL